MEEITKNALYEPTFDDVEAAYVRIRAQIHRTPVMTCQTLDRLAGKRLFFKCENLQKVGAFKFRGACNAVNRLSDTQAAKGVVTHSSGNHGQALALSAKMRGIPAIIVMPETAPRVKQAAVQGYGARIVLCEPTLEDRERQTAQVIAETGAHLVHPYNDPDVIAGQATVALELLEQVQEGGETLVSLPDAALDAIVTPVGGGGLLSGTCLSVAHLAPNTTIYGAEPNGADDAYRSLKAGRLIPQTNPRTVADGLKTSLGSLTWPIIQRDVTDIVTVSEDEIVSAMRLVWERMKLVVEPSAVVGLAAVLGEEFKRLTHQRVGIVLTGGNVDWPDSG